MTRFALITTTINNPTVLKRWADAGMMEDDCIIVAGDNKTPHTEVRETLDQLSIPTVYLHPAVQTKWYSSAAIGWNCIQRRNIALLEAIACRPDYIITIDDDNAPVPLNYFSMILNEFALKKRLVRSSPTEWWNAGQMCMPSVTHRGYPLAQRNFEPECEDRLRDAPLGVFASLWRGAPDIDAMERAVNDPHVVYVKPGTVTLDTHTWSPFNSQATVYRGDLAPLMYMWPHVGRFDDIWASYLARTVMDHLGIHVAYGHPIVEQDRNPHNIVADLQAEMFGYTHNAEIIKILRGVNFYGAKTMMECLRECFDTLRWNAGFLPQDTIDGFSSWYADVEDTLK